MARSVDLLLVMTVHPGWGGQAFIGEVMPKLRALRDEVDRRGLTLQIGVDGGVNLETPARAAAGESPRRRQRPVPDRGDLAPTVADLRAAARASASETDAGKDLTLLPALACSSRPSPAACSPPAARTVPPSRSSRRRSRRRSSRARWR